MPFRHLTPGRFDLDTLKLMQQAFDTVCAKLQIDESDTRRLTLANEIIRLAEEGERETLAEQAEEALALAMRPRKTGRLLFQNRRVRGQTGLRRNNSN